MAELNNIGIYYLSDLLKPEIYKKLSEILISTWNEILYIDQSVNIENLTPKQREDLKNWINPNYWQGLTEHPIKKKFNTEKERYQKIVKEHSANIQNQISKLIFQKWENLTGCFNLAKTENQEILTDNLKNGKQETGKIVHLITQSFIPNNEKRCPITGLNISMQVLRSKYLTSKGVEYYYKNEPELFKSKLLPRIGKKWRNMAIEIQFREIAHSFRNKKFDAQNNPRNNTKRAIFKVLKYPSLFDNMKLIDENKRRIAGL